MTNPYGKLFRTARFVRLPVDSSSRRYDYDKTGFAVPENPARALTGANWPTVWRKLHPYLMKFDDERQLGIHF